MVNREGPEGALAGIDSGMGSGIDGGITSVFGDIQLSHRLAGIVSMAEGEYRHIWDLCCDHGQLGAALLRQSQAQVHWVDIVESLMIKLQQQLAASALDDALRARCHLHCLDAADVPIQQQESGARQLVVIAGVGGDLMIELLAKLEANADGLQIDYLLCPVYHHYRLRQSLIELGLGLLEERLVHDRGRSYEVIKVSRSASTAISPVGSSMWSWKRGEHRRYLMKTVGHYRRIAEGGGDTEALQAYLELQRQLERVMDDS